MRPLQDIREAVSGHVRNARTFFQQRRLLQFGIGAIQGQIAALEQSIAAVEAGLKHRETPEYQWLVRQYLPARRRQKLEARCEIPPDDSIKQAMAQGQINELELQIGELSEIEAELVVLRERLDIAREAEAKWHQSQTKTSRRK
jgi:hypothetical protein